MHTFSLGKIRCFQQLTNEFGVFAMAAFDHRDVFVDTLSQTLGVEQPEWSVITAEKVRIARALAPHASAVLLDPLYSAGPVLAAGALPGDVAFAVAREKSGYSDTETGRVTVLLDDWSAAAIKRLGGSAVKLLLHYHPEAPTAEQQEAVVRQVAKECDAHEIPFMLEPICYPIEPNLQKTDAAFAKQRPEIILESARRLVPLGADILKVEFPTDPTHETDQTKMSDYCCQLTDICDGIPWVLLSAGVNFATFQRQVEIACEAGASGFVAGRAIWKETLHLPTADERDKFLNGLAVSRLRVLADTASYRAIPWHQRIANRIPQLESGWYVGYNKNS